MLRRKKPILENFKAGGIGCISATANINHDAYGTPEGDKLQAWINEVHGVLPTTCHPER